MLRTLGHPVSFVGLVVGFVVSVVVLQVAQAWTARALGDRVATRNVGWRHSFDPFGAVAAAVSVPGWGRTAEQRSFSPGRQGVALLMGPAAVLLVGAVAIAGYLLADGPRVFLDGGVGPGDIISADGDLRSVMTSAQVFLFCAGLEAVGFAVLSLVPLPPLTGWKLLALLSPKSLGWQRAHYWLEERNIGIVALLVLLLIPIGVGSTPLLVDLVDTIVGLLVSTVA